MQQTAVIFSKDEFSELCKRFDEANCYDFEPSGIEVIGVDVFRYETMYRDPDNYKSPVTFTCNHGVVDWEVDFGWDDAYAVIRTIYAQVVRDMINGEGIVILPVEEKSAPRDRLYCPKCSSKAAEPSGDRVHLDKQGICARIVCQACNSEFYIPIQGGQTACQTK